MRSGDRRRGDERMQLVPSIFAGACGAATVGAATSGCSSCDGVCPDWIHADVPVASLPITGATVTVCDGATCESASLHVTYSASGRELGCAATMPVSRDDPGPFSCSSTPTLLGVGVNPAFPTDPHEGSTLDLVVRDASGNDVAHHSGDVHWTTHCGCHTATF